MKTTTSFLACLACLLFSQIAQAANISVFPIRIDVSAPATSASVNLKNEAAQPVNIQIRIFKWVLKNGEDFYEESDDVVATPPVAVLTVTPGSLARKASANALARKSTSSKFRACVPSGEA